METQLDSPAPLSSPDVESIAKQSTEKPEKTDSEKVIEKDTEPAKPSIGNMFSKAGGKMFSLPQVKSDQKQSEVKSKSGFSMFSAVQAKQAEVKAETALEKPATKEKPVQPMEVKAEPTPVKPTATVQQQQQQQQQQPQAQIATAKDQKQSSGFASMFGVVKAKTALGRPASPPVKPEATVQPPPKQQQPLQQKLPLQQQQQQ